MKKLVSALATAVLMANTSFADTTNTATSATPEATVATTTATPVLEATNDENEAVYLTSTLKLVPTIQHTNNPDLQYTVKTNYPQITGGTLTPAAINFNQVMADMVKQETDRFTKFVKEDAVHMKTLPKEMQHNTLNIDYDIDVINSSKQPIISVRLSVEGMQGGRAHPYHTYRILNFSLSQNKVLSLNDIFKPSARYLNVFAKYTSDSLNKTLHDKFMIANGTAPDAKNYQTWNIEPDGILITFDEYQVAPYSDGGARG